MKKSNIIKKIIIIIILLLLVVIFISGTSLALPFGGYYNNVFQNKTLEEFFGITWDMVKDKTYGIQSTNDYRDYVYRSTDAYCMDEGVSDAGTGSGGFRARAIIDIEQFTVKEGRVLHILERKQKHLQKLYILDLVKTRVI